MTHCHACLIETRCLVTIATIGCVFSLHFLILLRALPFLHKISNFWFRNWLLHGWYFWFGPSGLPSLTFALFLSTSHFLTSFSHSNFSALFCSFLSISLTFHTPIASTYFVFASFRFTAASFFASRLACALTTALKILS